METGCWPTRVDFLDFLLAGGPAWPATCVDATACNGALLELTTAPGGWATVPGLPTTEPAAGAAAGVLAFLAARRFSGRAGPEPDATDIAACVCDIIGSAAVADALGTDATDDATTALLDVGNSVATEAAVAAAACAALLVRADGVETEPAAGAGIADDADTDVVVCVGLAATPVGVLVLALDSLTAVPDVPIALPAMVVGGVAADAGSTSVCDWVRARLPSRLTWAGGRPRLYSTISSSKRLRLIERDELRVRGSKCKSDQIGKILCGRDAVDVFVCGGRKISKQITAHWVGSSLSSAPRTHLRRFWSCDESGVDGAVASAAVMTFAVAGGSIGVDALGNGLGTGSQLCLFGKQ